MKFKNGYFGACVVVLALLGTVLAGFVTDIEKTTVSVTNFNYVTDVSGLFTYEQAPEYIDYSPSSNYTGYTGEVIYTATSSGVNQYRYVTSQGETATVTKTVDGSQTYPSDFYDSGVIRAEWNGSINFGSLQDPSTYVPFSANLQTGAPKATSLSSVVSSLLADSTLTNPETVKIDITYPGTAPVLFYTGTWEVQSVTLVGSTTNYYHAVLNESNTMPDHIDIDLRTNIATLKRGDTVMYQGLADNVQVLNYYNWRVSGNWAYAPATCDMTIEASEPDIYGYMDPTKGVYFHGATPRTAVWRNGYINDEVTLKLVGTNWHILRFAINNQTNYDFVVQWTDAGAIRVLKVSDGTYRDLGNWPACQVTIKGISGLVEVTPTTDTSMTSTVESNSYTYTFDDLFTPGTISSIRFSKSVGLSYSPHFQVTKTTVFLDTYNTVMNNPSLDIAEFFPDLADSYRLNFYSFAVLGSTITVNDTVMTVNKANSTVTFTDNGGTSRTESINNWYVTNNDDRTSLTFQNSNRTYDLGETIEDSTISFEGLWFFTTGLYQPVNGEQEVYNWNLDGAYHASAGQTLVIFLGIMGLSIILAVGYFKVNIRVLDWILLIGAAFFVLIYFGGLV